MQFVTVAMAYGLNPIRKEIYCIPYGKGDKRKLSIITGYETYLKRADRTGKLSGWRAWTEGTYELKKKPAYNGDYEKSYPSGNMKAIVEIHRKDWTTPFTHEVYLNEYAQANDMWCNKTITMLKKVATAQGFRMCFPDEIGGMPYTTEELPDNMTTMRDVTPQVTPPVEQEAPASASDERVGAIYRLLKNYIGSGYIAASKAEEIRAVIDSGESNIQKLERYLDKVKDAHDKAVTEECVEAGR